MIQRAKEAVLEENSLLESLATMDKLFDQVKFDDSAKFCFLCIAVMKIPQLATFAMYCGVTEYDMLVKSIKEYEISKKVFNTTDCRPASSSTIDARSIVYPGGKKLMVHPDAFLQNFDMKIDTIAVQMEILMLMMNHKVEPGPSRTGNVRKTRDDSACSYCGESGHIAARCENNPNKYRHCGHCGKKDTS